MAQDSLSKLKALKERNDGALEKKVGDEITSLKSALASVESREVCLSSLLRM